jgi:L-alanine-DL-glutamate epimerase-like enolase superfamily enzyme
MLPQARIMNVKMKVETERWPYRAPFRLTGHVRDFIDVVVVTLSRDGRAGRGEAAGVRYRGETAANLVETLERCRNGIERDISRARVQTLLPPGGARNALDCALWDLESKLSGCPVWQMMGLELPRPLLTTFTLSADSPDATKEAAQGYGQAKILKLKLTGDGEDEERLRAVRSARRDVRLVVDANQGFTTASLKKLMPSLINAGVELIEQPFPVGKEGWLDEIESPIPIAADESVQSLLDIEAMAGRFKVINIKLDKCGGLTEALAMSHVIRDQGLELMIGNMGNTSLAMAPAWLIGQMCSLVDLDGPIVLKKDRQPSAIYHGGFIECPGALWGNPEVGQCK